jgi:hypothetical protein
MEILGGVAIAAGRGEEGRDMNGGGMEGSPAEMTVWQVSRGGETGTKSRLMMDEAVWSILARSLLLSQIFAVVVVVYGCEVEECGREERLIEPALLLVLLKCRLCPFFLNRLL